MACLPTYRGKRYTSLEQLNSDVITNSEQERQLAKQLYTTFLQNTNSDIYDINGFKKFLAEMKTSEPKNMGSYAYIDNLSNATKINDDTYKASNGNEYGTVTSTLMPAMQRNPFTSTDTVGTRQAENYWLNRPADEKIKFSNIAVPVTKSEYIAKVDRDYEIGRYKGIIFHAIISSYITGDDSKLTTLYQESGLLQTEFSWLTNDNIVKILKKTGTDAFDPNPKDKLLSEVAITNDILKIGGTMDLVVDHGDDIYSIYDIKTGRHFNKTFEFDFFKYGRTSTRDIFVTPRNKAKLQIMLYAMLLKMEKPNARFRNLELLYINNKYSVDDVDAFRHINIESYLEMIENYFKAEKPDEYKQIKEKYPDIFNPKTYNYVKQQNNRTAAEELRIKNLELQALVMYDKDLHKNFSNEKFDANTRFKRMAELTKEIADLRSSANDLSSQDTDMGWMDRWLGSASASTNPYVKLYTQVLTQQKQKAREDYLTWRGKYDKILTKLAQERTGLPITKLIKGIDRNKLFSFAYKGDRLYHSGDPEYKNMTQTEREFLDFANDSVEMFFDDSKAYYSTDGKALANKKITYFQTKGKQIPLTNLDLFNGKFSDNPRKEFQYYKGFFPKYPPQMYDISSRFGAFSDKMRKYLYNHYFTTYFETVYDRWDASREAIPMKYLDNESIASNENYTTNLELSIDNFVKQHFYKYHLDEVHAFGLGLKVFLEYQSRTTGLEFENLSNWLDDSINLHILGRKQQEVKLAGRSFGRVTDRGYKQFNGVKFLRSVKTFFGGATMWLKVFTGTANAVFANLVTFKEGLKNSLFGNAENAKFTLSDLMEGQAIAYDLYVRDGLSDNKFRSNKAYLLMEKFGYMPDNVDWYTSKNSLLTANNRLFSSRTLLMFHTIPEEILATAMFVAQLKAMSTVDLNGNKISMWDAYTVRDGKVVYTGGIRGKRNISNISDNPQYVDVGELEIEEINSIKFLYEKIHGGYRLDERAAMEYYVLGEIMLQLKRYLPSILKNAFASRGKRETEGYFKEVEENGVKVLKWSPAVIEGRWRMLLGLLYNYLALKSRTPGEKGSKTRTIFGIQFDESYDWDSLSEQQKEDMKDFFLTTAMYLLMFLGGKMMWDDDEDSSLKKIYTNINRDVGAVVNPFELIKNVINLLSPVVAKKSIKVLDASTEFFWASMLYTAGYEDEALTRQGNLRGSIELRRNIHFLSAYHDVFSKISESEQLSNSPLGDFFNVKER
ncbi:MAG: PD-(D/E)XK nuclease family protein [Bacteroidota bacterium]